MFYAVTASPSVEATISARQFLHFYLSSTTLSFPAFTLPAEWVLNLNCDVLLYGPEIRLPDEEHVPISLKIQLFYWSPFLLNLSKSRKLWQDFSSFPAVSLDD